MEKTYSDCCGRSGVRAVISCSAAERPISDFITSPAPGSLPSSPHSTTIVYTCIYMYIHVYMCIHVVFVTTTCLLVDGANPRPSLPWSLTLFCGQLEQLEHVLACNCDLKVYAIPEYSRYIMYIYIQLLSASVWFILCIYMKQFLAIVSIVF